MTALIRIDTSKVNSVVVVMGCAGSCNQGRRSCDCAHLWASPPAPIDPVPVGLTWKQRFWMFVHRHIVSKEVH